MDYHDLEKDSFRRKGGRELEGHAEGRKVRHGEPDIDVRMCTGKGEREGNAGLQAARTPMAGPCPRVVQKSDAQRLQ
jgi:hypothetical protein